MGWILINIFVPTLAPVVFVIAFFPIRKYLPPANQVLVRFIAPVKDAQMCWAGMAFCAAGLYELHEATSGGIGLKDPAGGAAQAFFSVGLIFNSILATTGAIFPVDLPRPATETRWTYYPMLRWSVVLSSLSAIVFAVVRFQLSAS